MAIDVPTELFTVASGSVGDVVFSHNQHGPYIRDRTFPTDPATPQQLAVRGFMTQLVTAWRTALTPTERRAWDAFALAVPRRTALARRTNAGGLAMYIRANVPRLQAGPVVSPRVDQAPTSFTAPPLTLITRVVLNYVDDTLHPFFDPDDAWANEFRSPVLFWASPPVAPTRNFYKGPYRFAGEINGGPLGVVQNPATIPLPFPADATDRIFIRGRLSTSDGRLAPSFRLPADPVPAIPPAPIKATDLGGFPQIVALDVDATLQIQTHDPANWSVRLNNQRHSVVDVFSLPPNRTRLQLELRTFTPEIGIDAVAFTPPPFDVLGLLTGLPMAAFADFPITA